MRTNLYIFTLLAALLFCTASQAQVKMIKGDWITELASTKSDTIYVVNFWATWCKPCVQELPYFEQITKEFSTQKVKVILVSCDFKKQVNSRLIPFIKEKNIRSEVVFMDESNPNTWIDKVDPSFSGAIPSTLILKGNQGFRHFSEGETTYNDLVNIITPLIQKP
jgi:thiol-disulfide isomerase/thioredoxin